jgi:hypothetical protein
MGMEHAVTYSTEVIRFWPRLSELLGQRGLVVQPRMIDGELALPDETPPEGWKELRLGTPHGMLTLRKEDKRMLVITWGNADAPLRQAWNAVTWAVAEVTKGQIQTPAGAQASEDFLRTAELPTGFHT